MSQKKSRVFMMVVAALFLFAGEFGDRAEAQTKRLSIGTADTGGVYYIYGGGISKLISSSIPNTVATAEVTPGAVDNVKMLQNNSLDLALPRVISPQREPKASVLLRARARFR